MRHRAPSAPPSLGLLVLLIGLSWASAQGQEVKEKQEKKELIVCALMDNHPFYFSDDGELKGVEHDILAAFAQHKGMGLRTVPSEKAMTDVAAGTCDIAASTVTRTPDRERDADFSLSYFPVRIVAVEKRSSVTTRPEALRGKTIATLTGSTYLKAAETLGEIEVLFVDSTEEMFQAVASGKADFLACDSAVVLSRLQEYPDLHITVPLSERSELAFVTAKGSSLVGELSDFMAEARRNGTMAGILTRYFDAETVEMILDD